MDKYREQPEALARGNFFTDFSHLDLNKKYQVSELLKFLRTKANASDLLETVAQALERVYHDAAKSGNANMEVSMARGGFDTLGERLNDTTTQLTQKANQSFAKDIENRLNNVINGLDGTEEFYTPIGLEQYMTTQGQEWRT